VLGDGYDNGGDRDARRCAFANEGSRGLCDRDSAQTKAKGCLQKTWLLRRGVLGVWRDDVVGAEGAWSEVGGRTRRLSLLNQPALGPTCQCNGNMDAPLGFTGQRSPPARSDAHLHPARRIGCREATWRQAEDPYSGWTCVLFRLRRADDCMNAFPALSRCTI
jgi:hypothetical protein